VAVVTAFEAVRHNEFLDFDDDEYVHENVHVLQGLTPEAVRWVFTSEHTCNWHPVTGMSHLLDVELFGTEPRGHHVHNLILHALNAVLLFLFLYKALGNFGVALFVACVFAVHPQRVESVAWISERKGVLSGLFFMLLLLSYLQYARRRSGGWYAGVLLCLCVGLMAKPILVTAPFVLLLLDFWPLRRHAAAGAYGGDPWEPGPGEGWGFERARLKTLILEKLPMFAVVAVSCTVTFFVQRSAGQVQQQWEFPFHLRLGNAFHAYGQYLLKTFYPTNLAAYYPHPGNRLEAVDVLVPLAVIVLLSVAALATLRRQPWFAVG